MDINTYPENINPRLDEFKLDKIARSKLEPYASQFEKLIITPSRSGFAVFVKIDNETNASEPRYKAVIKKEADAGAGYRHWFCWAWLALTEACENAEGDEERFRLLWKAKLYRYELIPDFGELWIGPVPEELRKDLVDELKEEQ